jgi:peptidoglycan hydrolase-like protein with peptidoglycan-binding domain
MKKTLLSAAAVSAALLLTTGNASAADAFRCASSTGWCTYVEAQTAAESNTANIQQRLIALGYSVPGGANGILNHSTRLAIKTFQRDNGLIEDGVVGTQTASALNNRTHWMSGSSYAYNGAQPAGYNGWNPSAAYGYYGPVIVSGVAYGR